MGIGVTVKVKKFEINPIFAKKVIQVIQRGIGLNIKNIKNVLIKIWPLWPSMIYEVIIHFMDNFDFHYDSIDINGHQNLFINECA